MQEGGEHEVNQESPDEPDMWEETFKTHTDSKPNGINKLLKLTPNQNFLFCIIVCQDRNRSDWV